MIWIVASSGKKFGLDARLEESQLLDYPVAFASLDQLIREKMSAHDTPGLAIAITDQDNLSTQQFAGHFVHGLRRKYVSASRFDKCAHLISVHRSSRRGREAQD